MSFETSGVFCLPRLWCPGPKSVFDDGGKCVHRGLSEQLLTEVARSGQEKGEILL